MTEHGQEGEGDLLRRSLEQLTSSQLVTPDLSTPPVEPVAVAPTKTRATAKPKASSPRVLTLEISEKPRYNVDDLQLLLEVLVLDQPLAPADLITLAQARQYMSTRPDGSIPFVMRKGVVEIHRKAMARRPR